MFLTERWDGSATSASNNSWEVTLAEILGAGGIDNMGMTSEYNLQKAVWKNIQMNWMASGMTLVGIKTLDKVLQKAGVWRNFNKIVRQMGLGQVVKA